MDSMSFTDDLRSDFLRRMKSARLDAELKQTDVIKELEKYGVHMGPSTYAKVERGERKLDFAEALAVAQVLGFSVSDMAPEPVKSDEEIMREAKNIFASTAGARTVAVDAITPILRAVNALDRMKSLCESDPTALKSEADRKLVEILLQPRVRQELMRRIDSLQGVADQLDELETLDFNHRASRLTPVPHIPDDAPHVNPDDSES